MSFNSTNMADHNSPKQALILQGGWEGHDPKAFARFFEDRLKGHGFSVEVATDLSVLDDPEFPKQFDLIVPNWTMGELEGKRCANLCAAVRAGTGLGGSHGGMGDAFRGSTEYEWMVGGHFVGHPYVGPYTVTVRDRMHPVTRDLPESFEYVSEQYYMLIDPAIKVLADTVYHHDGGAVSMPVIWTKKWGAGRIFYSALGHDPKEFETYPHVADMTVNGLLWASVPERNS